MRRVVLLAHEVPTDPDFPLDALPGEAGRLDLLARAVNTSLLLSHGIRDDVTTHLVVRDEHAVRFEGASLRGLHPDERSTAAQVRAVLESAQELVGAAELEHSSGITVRNADLETVLADAGGTLVQLHEDGEPAADVEPPADPVFVLSDHRDFTEAEARLLESAADHRLRLGPHALHADAAVAVAHNWVDTGGYRDY